MTFRRGSHRRVVSPRPGRRRVARPPAQGGWLALALALLSASAPAALAGSLVGAAGCGGVTVQARAGAGLEVAIPARLSAETFADARRAYDLLEPADPRRAALRARLAAYLAEQARGPMEAGDYDAVVEAFAAITALHTSQELGRGDVERALRESAAWLLERGEPRGDEARVLSALLVLAAVDADRRDALRARYDEIAAWGPDARDRLASPVQRYGGLVRVWEEHARLTPAPAVLDRLARLYVERRDAYGALLALRGERLFGRGLSLDDLREANFAASRAPLDVAAAFLAAGDVASALARVEGMGGLSSSESQVAEVLRIARAGGADGDEALLVLARGYMEEGIGRPEVARALCTLGRRRSPADARFPQCLARIAALDRRYGDATALYADAIRLAPDERGLYDEALSVLNDLIARGYFTASTRDAHALARQAETILDERMRRFPSTRPPVPPEQLYLVIAESELAVGEVDEARRHLERSIATRTTGAALARLGELLDALGESTRAEELLRRALDEIPERSREDSGRRAEVLEKLGDAQRRAGRTAQAERSYAEALAGYERVALSRAGRDLGLVHVRRAVVLDRLGRRADALAAFRQALGAGRGQLEVYARVLSYLVSAEPADAPLALEVFRASQRQLRLPAEWRVYFALWVRAIAARATEPAAREAASREATEALAAVRGASGWSAQLARFATGALPYPELLAAASNRGEQAEAHFYEAMRQLAEGRAAEARALLDKVLETRMVSFYEYQIAQRLGER
jgi:tetratricopeptide (TPR) repeat protein